MDIAIVSPSPKPFAVGGIEKLMLGLYGKIDESTNHRVELFKIPTLENDFWSLINSYENFNKLDLDHFDMVITCKYPAWMVNHKNHVVYMAHHLRGLFDTYHFMKLPGKLGNTPYPSINNILQYVRHNSNLNSDLDGLFESLKQLNQSQSQYPKEYFTFPGPFIREIVHFLDAWALHPNRISRYTSISETVKARKDYFPDGVNVDVIYPPTALKGLSEGEYNYFLVVGRLDGPKRVDMIVEAMKHINNPNIKLLIAGSGPEENRLKAMSFGDERIQFLGYINSQVLIDLYRDALAVIYIPYDEDYGLVTIEAMQCRKPVITCKDSGGTTEFVNHNKTGLVADNNSNSLAKQIETLANDKAYAEELGTNAKEFVSHITWDYCVSKLLNNPEIITSKRSEKNKEKIIVLSTYPVFPRKHGGQLRIFNLYKNLTAKYDITIISLTKEPKGYEKRINNLKEICIPMSQKHIEKEWEIERDIGIPITDIVMRQLSYLTPLYQETIDTKAMTANILITAHPYLFHVISKYIGKKQIIYDAHNVEYELKKSMLPNNKKSKKLLDSLFELEQEACLKSDLVFVCSEKDKEIMIDLYNINQEKMVTVPNGVDLSLNPYVSYEQRQINKKQLGLENEKIIVFIGSWHKPNLEAVEEILKFAPSLPDVKFIIMGGQCLAFKDRNPPPNIAFAGVVDENLKRHIYSIADIAINPMVNGSGTNLKIAEYMANGIPVISTSIGSRGYGVINEQHLIISSINDFVNNLKLLLCNQEKLHELSVNSREYVQENFAWNMIAERVELKM
jgi:glycosyltransferase involved in cell wall biosynthesis